MAALIASAVAEVADVLPGATSLAVLDETNEDGPDILRRKFWWADRTKAIGDAITTVRTCEPVL